VLAVRLKCELSRYQKPGQFPWLIRLDCPTHRIKQAATGKGFEQPGHGAELLCRVAQGRLIMGRDEDDGPFDALFDQSLEELNAGQAGEMNIENKAGGGLCDARLQEGLGRGERPGREAGGVQHSLQGAHHTGIIFDDDYLLLVCHWIESDQWRPMPHVRSGSIETDCI
jgi:hypothetical protein